MPPSLTAFKYLLDRLWGRNEKRKMNKKWIDNMFLKKYYRVWNSWGHRSCGKKEIYKKDEYNQSTHIHRQSVSLVSQNVKRLFNFSFKREEKELKWEVRVYSKRKKGGLKKKKQKKQPMFLSISMYAHLYKEIYPIAKVLASLSVQFLYYWQSFEKSLSTWLYSLRWDTHKKWALVIWFIQKLASSAVISVSPPKRPI